MDRFDAAFESTYCCMHKLVIYKLNDLVEVKLLRHITENSPNKENVFFFSSTGIDQMLPVTKKPLTIDHSNENTFHSVEYSNEHSTYQFDPYSMGKKGFISCSFYSKIK